MKRVGKRVEVTDKASPPGPKCDHSVTSVGSYVFDGIIFLVNYMREFAFNYVVPIQG